MSMSIARLADEVFALLGDFSDDPELCALTCSDRARWESSTSQRQTRKDEQALYLQLKGRAWGPWDCQLVAELLDPISIRYYMSECFWGTHDELRPDVDFHIEFECERCRIPRLHRAVKLFLSSLRGLGGMQGLRVLRETLTFQDEYTGVRIPDHGEHHQADILHRLSQKLVCRVNRMMEPYPYCYGEWLDYLPQ